MQARGSKGGPAPLAKYYDLIKLAKDKYKVDDVINIQAFCHRLACAFQMIRELRGAGQGSHAASLAPA